MREGEQASQDGVVLRGASMLGGGPMRPSALEPSAKAGLQ
jgi:hypothetical protein